MCILVWNIMKIIYPALPNVWWLQKCHIVDIPWSMWGLSCEMWPILAYPINNNQVSKCSQRVSLLTLCRILHGVASGCDGSSSTSTLPSSNTIQTAGFLWLLTFNSLGTHGGRCPSNCLDPGFSNVCCCLPCCPPQSKHGFRVHNQTAVSELKSLYGESIVWPSVPSNHFQYHSTFVTLDSVYFNCNFKIVSVGCFTIYRLQSAQTGVLQLASHCHEMPVPHVN